MSYKQTAVIICQTRKEPSGFSQFPLISWKFFNQILLTTNTIQVKVKCWFEDHTTEGNILCRYFQWSKVELSKLFIKLNEFHAKIMETKVQSDNETKGCLLSNENRYLWVTLVLLSILLTQSLASMKYRTKKIITTKSIWHHFIEQREALSFRGFSNA